MGPLHTYIAVIDSDPVVCRNLCRLLRSANFVPISYSSAEEYLNDPVHEYFSAILTDVELGPLSGLELQRRLANDGRKTVVIFNTACEDPAVHQTAVQQGCAGYFLKSDTEAPIAECLRNALRPPPLGQ